MKTDVAKNPNLDDFLKELFVTFEQFYEKDQEVSIYFRTYKETKTDAVKLIDWLGKYQMMVYI